MPRSQRYFHHGGEGWIFPQHPGSKSEVLPKRLTETRASRFAAFLANALHIAKALPRLARRFLRRHPIGDVLCRALLDVKAQFLVNLLLHASRRCHSERIFNQIFFALVSRLNGFQAVCRTSVMAR